MGYAGNNPIGAFDPLGLDTTIDGGSSGSPKERADREPRFHDAVTGPWGCYSCYGFGGTYYVNGFATPAVVAQRLLSMGAAVQCPGNVCSGFATQAITHNSDGSVATAGLGGIAVIESTAPALSVANLPVPGLPAGMSNSAFGQIMGWGTGNQALSQIGNLTLGELSASGITADKVLEWAMFYSRQFQVNPANVSADARAVLLYFIYSHP